MLGLDWITLYFANNPFLLRSFPQNPHPLRRTQSELRSPRPRKIHGYECGSGENRANSSETPAAGGMGGLDLGVLGCMRITFAKIVKFPLMGSIRRPLA